jgi:hypothetical protein
MFCVKNHLSLGLCTAALTVASSSFAAPAPDRLVDGEASQNGSSLVAGKQGATYELRGGARVTIAEGSVFAFDPSIHLKLGKTGDTDTFARAVRLLHGRADVEIPANLSAAPAVFLRSPGKMAAVAKEGRSTFLVAEDHASVASRSGEMLVGIGNDWKPLKEGLARTLSPMDPTALPHPLLTAPTAAPVHRLVITKGNAAGSVDMSWSSLADAASYEVTVTPAEGSRGAVRQVTSDTKGTVGSLAPGAYEVSVAGVDRQGLAGAASTSVAVRVVGVETPEGAEVVADGTVVLGKDQAVSLVGAKGLEVAYGESTVFGAVHDGISLAHGLSTTARLRLPGTAEEALLHLEPKGLRARVDIGPKLARWPLDRVTLAVELYDASGRPIPDDAKVEPTVTVNLAPAQLRWQRSGNWLRASLPASTEQGPWVIRAEVKDDQGNLIGRNFLEVARVTPEARPAMARR